MRAHTKPTSLTRNLFSSVKKQISRPLPFYLSAIWILFAKNARKYQKMKQSRYAECVRQSQQKEKNHFHYSSATHDIRRMTSFLFWLLLLHAAYAFAFDVDKECEMWCCQISSMRAKKFNLIWKSVCGVCSAHTPIHTEPLTWSIIIDRSWCRCCLCCLCCFFSCCFSLREH